MAIIVVGFVLLFQCQIVNVECKLELSSIFYSRVILEGIVKKSHLGNDDDIWHLDFRVYSVFNDPF